MNKTSTWKVTVFVNGKKDGEIYCTRKSVAITAIRAALHRLSMSDKVIKSVNYKILRIKK